MAAISNAEVPKILWQHPKPESTQMYRFKRAVEKKHGLNLPVRLNATQQLELCRHGIENIPLLQCHPHI